MSEPGSIFNQSSHNNNVLINKMPCTDSTLATSCILQSGFAFVKTIARSYSKIATLIGISFMVITLSACSIKDETSEELRVKPDDSISLYDNPQNDEEQFIHDAIICIQGDLSGVDKLIATYKSSFLPGTNYKEGSFKYQRILPTKAFEKCAEKAASMGNRTVFSNMFITQGKIVRSARYFYAVGEPTQGAFWLQRLVNVKGEVDAYEIAGRIFIQDIRTLKIGVKLLEQSARMGNRNARQLLLGLMNPGSLYYHQITTSTDSGDQPSEANRTTLSNVANSNNSNSAQNTTGTGTGSDTKAETRNGHQDSTNQGKASSSQVDVSEDNSSLNNGRYLDEKAQNTNADGISYADNSEAPEADRSKNPDDAIGSQELPQQQSPNGISSYDYNKTINEAQDILEKDFAAEPDHKSLVPESQEKKDATPEGAFSGPATYTDAAIEAALTTPAKPNNEANNYDPVSVVNSSDTELNTPLELYEIQSSTEPPKDETGANHNADKAKDNSEHNAKNTLNLQQKKQIENEDRLKSIQEKADAATKAVLERTKQMDN